jgi:hypothetical protein
MICSIANYYYGDQTKVKEMGGACGMCGLGKMCAGFGWEKCKEREYVEDLGMVGEIILK